MAVATKLAPIGCAVRVDNTRPENDLIEEAKTSREALAVLYGTYQPRISAYVLRRMGDKHEAEDIVANVFVAMVQRLPRYRPSDTPFSAWLYRIATNQIKYSIRKRRIRTFFGGPPDVIDRRPESLDDGELLRFALRRLPFAFQNVVSLYYLEQLSVSDVAKVLQCPTGTVKSRLARGRELLQMELLRLHAQ
jgi:RNA polymerase sigma-70 factor (ECF subfamily)